MINFEKSPGDRDTNSANTKHFFGQIQCQTFGALKVYNAIRDECPRWFQNLPTFTLFIYVSYVVHVRIQAYRMTMRAADNAAQERDIAEYFAKLSEEEEAETQGRHELFYDFLNHMVFDKYIDVRGVWEVRIRSLMDDLPETTKTCMKASLDLLFDLDRIFPLASVLNTSKLLATGAQGRAVGV